MKNLAALAFVLTSFSSFSQSADIRIDSLSIVRTGGGQFEAVVTKTGANKVSVFTKSCNFKEEFNEEQRALTQFDLEGETLQNALAVFNGEAVLLSDESIRHPGLLGGTWSTLEIRYSYLEFENKYVSDNKVIARPMIVIEGKVSPLLERIEASARGKSAEICNEQLSDPFVGPLQIQE